MMYSNKKRHTPLNLLSDSLIETGNTKIKPIKKFWKSACMKFEFIMPAFYTL